MLAAVAMQDCSRMLLFLKSPATHRHCQGALTLLARWEEGCQLGAENDLVPGILGVVALRDDRASARGNDLCQC